jgi:hypothetical protein
MFLRVNNSYPTNLLETILEENEKYYKFKEEIIYLEHNKILLKENFYKEELLENVVSSLWEHLKNFVLKILKFLAYPFVALVKKVNSIIRERRKVYIQNLVDDLADPIEAKIVERFSEIPKFINESMNKKVSDVKQSFKDRFSKIVTSIKSIGKKDLVNNMKETGDVVIPELIKCVNEMEKKLIRLKNQIESKQGDPDEINKEISFTAEMIMKTKNLITELTRNLVSNSNKI